MRSKKGKRFAEKHSTKKKKNKLIYNIIIIICIIVILFSAYNITLWLIENNNNNSLISDIQSDTNITEEIIMINNEPITKNHYDFSELLNKNSQTVGWISVPNTNINYPVVQNTDNDYYLNHSFNKSSNSAGWIFADYTCDCINSKNVILYGHNRKDKSMFGSLKNVLDDDWRANSSNLYINFSNLNESHVYKIFSVFVCNDTNVDSYLKINFKTDTELKNYVQKLKNISSYKFDTDVENPQKIITLYTCHGLNNQRLIVCATMVS